MTRGTGEDVRWLYCEFLKDVGMRLKIPQLTIATAIVFCHRFYSRHEVDPAQNDLHTIATACIFLAGKVEETPKSLSDLLKVSTVVKHRTLEDQSSLLLQDMNFVQEQRERILIAERSLLHTLAFDFNIEHPYKFLLSTVKQMQAYSYIAEDNTRDLAQIAWNFANDRYADLLGHRLFLSDNQFEDNSLSSSLRESLCKRCHLSRYDDRESLTSALTMLTATKFMGTKLNLPKDWCSALGMDERECEKISNEILDVYERSDRVVSAQISKSAFQ